MRELENILKRITYIEDKIKETKGYEKELEILKEEYKKIILGEAENLKK